MFSTPSKFLIIILALLQLVAPLVHAHAGDQHSNNSIHLPGFEHYNAGHDTPAFHAITQPSINDCSLISVGNGIKLKKSSINNVTVFYLPTENFWFRDVIRQTLVLPLPFQKQTLPKIARYTFLPQRAPPVFI